jgi:hypothetical protein
MLSCGDITAFYNSQVFKLQEAVRKPVNFAAFTETSPSESLQYETPQMQNRSQIEFLLPKYKATSMYVLA